MSKDNLWAYPRRPQYLASDYLPRGQILEFTPLPSCKDVNHLCHELPLNGLESIRLFKTARLLAFSSSLRSFFAKYTFNSFSVISLGSLVRSLSAMSSFEAHNPIENYCNKKQHCKSNKKTPANSRPKVIPDLDFVRCLLR